MLLGSAAILLAAQALAVPPAAPAAGMPAAAPEIEVVGRRLARLHLEIGLDSDGLTSCRITVPSGDGFIDAQACPAAAFCARRPVRTYRVLLACMNGQVAAAVLRHDMAPPRR